MDPNATLAAIRAALDEYYLALDASDDEIQAARELAEHVQALDSWLSRGGFLPKEWQR